MQPSRPPAAPMPPSRRTTKTGHRIALWAGICVAAAATALLVIWLIGAGSFLAGSFSDTTEAKPDKYHETNFASCADLAAHSPELPQEASEVLRSWHPEETKDGTLLCSFTPLNDQRPIVRLQATWFGTTDAHAGNQTAESTFIGAASLSKDDSAVGLSFGEKAHWLPEVHSPECGLVVLDRNAMFQVHYTPAKPDNNPETCRGPLRKMAQALYHAAQPR
ncbi:hypothetical protein [Amycolatopsis sp. WGS_07]|uniref:hypothetical protein n=1 Tax=Amycolatopsis sp. WGS_07 TaxID=3076764 RepID=UPI00387367FC